MKNAEGGLEARTSRCHGNSFNKLLLHILAVEDVSEVGGTPGGLLLPDERARTVV